LNRSKNKSTEVILQVLPHLGSGGLVSGAIEIANAIVQQGWRSIILTAGGFRRHEAERIGAEVEILPVDSKNIFTMRRNATLIEMFCKKNQVSLIHARSRAPAWSAFWALKNINIPFVTTFHGTYGSRGPFKKAYNRVMLKSDRTIAISSFIKEHIEDIYGKTDNIVTIPRGVDTKLFSPLAVTAERSVSLAKRFKVDEMVPVVLMPGRMVRWKGHMLALEALLYLKRPNVRLLFIGDDEGKHTYIRQLQEKAKNLGVDGQIQFVGHSRDMPSVFKLSDVVLSLSTKPEAFGRVIVEALAMGRPVVATDNGAAKELIDHKQTGWLVSVNDPRGIAEAISKCLDLSSKDREILASRAIKSVKKNYTTKKMCTSTIELYKGLIAKSK